MKSASVLAVIFAVLSAPAFAQAPASRPATMDDVVAEIRALRADMQKTAEASVRAQLLVARLQVQEQRIASLARELAQADEQVRGMEAARNPFTEMMLKQLDAEPPKEPGEADFAAAFKAQLERIQNGDPALKERQASLKQLIAEEQARWAAFNAQLEALERDLPALKKK
jgi:hypothetical protein